MATPRLSSPLSRLKALVAPGLIFIIIMSVTITLRNVSVRLIQEDVRQLTEEECRKVVYMLDLNIRENMKAMEGVAKHLKYNRIGEKLDFTGYSKSVMEESQGAILAIFLTNESLEPLWAQTEQPLLDKDFTAIFNRRTIGDTLRKVRDTGHYAITEPLTFPGFGQGFAVVTPCEWANGQRGYVVGILPYKFEDWMLLPDRQDFIIQLRQADTQIPTTMVQQIHEGEIPGAGGRQIAGFTLPFFLGSQKWEVSVVPTADPGKNRYFFTSAAILTLGTILALVASMLLYRQQVMAAKSQDEAKDSKVKLASTSTHLANITEELDLILNNVDEGIILYDENLNPLQANESFKQSFVSPDEQSRLDPLAESHHRKMSGLFQNESQYWALLNKLRANPERPVADEIEVRHEGTEEKPRSYQRRATAVCGPDGSRRGYLVIYQDMTAKRNVERLKEDFLSSVTHDLRTPVAAIKGFAETMLKNQQMDRGTRDEFTNIICDESSRLQEMIEDLLDLRRMEEGRLDLALGSYYLRALVGDLVRSLQPLIESHDLGVVIEWEGGPPRPLSGDVAKISRAIRNVLSNSLKYSPPHSKIWIRGVEEDDRAELEITDEGAGIPPDEIEHIFEKFFRGASHVRRTQGTGLGLAITKHIIESHGGLVTASNDPSRGAKIKMVLPRQLDLARIPSMETIRPEQQEADAELSFPVMPAG